MSHLRVVNPDEHVTAPLPGGSMMLAAPIMIAGGALGGALKGLFWGWVISRWATPTGHPIKRGALIGAGIGAAVAVLGVTVGTIARVPR